jgi:TatD DNase family protein
MNIRLIDTHAHIYADEFDADLTAVIKRSTDAGITKIIMPAIDTTCHEKMLRVEKDFPDTCNSMMGLHPCYVKDNYKEELAVAETYLTKRKFVAVGEIGLDFYWDVTFKEQQYAAFQQQIEWALHYDIPIAIHSRNATDECIAVVKEHQKGKLKGVFHCFSGNAEQAQQLVELGFYLGIGGVLTFKNAGVDKALEAIDLSSIVLETDAPYLAPVPYRGKRNEMSYLTYIAQKLADVKKTSLEEVAHVTTANAEKLFGV